MRPAAPGENADPVVDISKAIASGSAEITDQQLADLQSGKWYLNIHTQKFPDGEIRGQVEKAQ
ncbi:CHRD domain-containing protein [Sinorhizobium fredii]|uniref:CHRD domain-containing protein n=1 Tax=Rhizobium fredii TaxID=380 RepID=UPI0035160957